MKYFYTILLVLLFSPISFAACINPSTNPKQVINIPSFTYNRNTIPIGGVIGSELIGPPFDVTTCDAGDTWRNITFNRQSLTTATTINGRTVFYSANTQSVGFSMGIEMLNACTSQGTMWISSSVNCADTANLDKTYTYQARLHIILYKLSNNIPATSIIIPNSSNLFALSSSSNNDTLVAYYLSGNIFKIITNAGCTLQNSTVSVALPTVYGQKFQNVGSTSGSTPFNISINCPSPTQLALTFTDNNKIGQTGSALTPTTTSTATGIGIQLQYNGQVVNFGPDSSDPGTINQIVLNSNLTGVQSFPFTASYVRTGAVTPGSLSATATFTLSYQ
ncbi:fimbrial protein [Aquitalea sp.]|uniref:fimbrial protein n=1 Tax=Aquitalea sp. TaxID=1872623 RepID=UPI00258282CE|nr:fimbrial protein [Aquitalea sp.]